MNLVSMFVYPRFCVLFLCMFSYAHQIDKLSSELLSQQTKHDRLVQEMKDSHEEEVNSIKRRSEEDVARLQSQVELLQKESTKVQISLAGQPLQERGRVWCHAYMRLVLVVMLCNNAKVVNHEYH